MIIKNTISLLFIFSFFITAGFCQNTGSVVCTEYDEYILTHELVTAGPIPTALDPNGVYPYVSYSETSNRSVPKKYHFIDPERVR